MDIPDIAKPCAEKMEHLARVRDGGSGGRDRRRLLAMPGDRGRERGHGDHAALQRTLIFPGCKPFCMGKGGDGGTGRPVPDAVRHSHRARGERAARPASGWATASGRRACRTIRTSPSGRWRTEEAIRFGKQSYGLEDIRAPTRERPRNMAVLVKRRRLLHRRGPGNTDQARHPRHPPARGIQASVRHPRLPSLRHGRRHPRGQRQSPQAPITSQHRRSTPAQPRPAVEFFGECPGNLPVDNATGLCDYINS